MPTAEPTVQIRVAELSEAERSAVDALSYRERADMLIQAGMHKQRQLLGQLRQAQIARVQVGTLKPLTHDEQGQPYTGLHTSVAQEGVDGVFTDLGRVPGAEEMHVLRAENGMLHIVEEGRIRAANSTGDLAHSSGTHG